MNFVMILSTLLITMSVSCKELDEKLVNYLKKKHDLTISVTGHPDYPPIIWFSKKEDTLKGVAVELVENIFQEIGVKVKFKPVATWGRALEEVNQGRIDLLLPPYMTDERKEFYHFTKNPFMDDKTVLFFKKGKNLKFESLHDLKKYQGVAIINDSFGDEFDDAAKNFINIQRLAKTEQCVRFLLRDRADYLVAGYSAGISVASSIGAENQIEVHEKPVIKTGMYLGISKKSNWGDALLLNYLDSRIAEIKASDKIQELERKYLKIYQEDSKKK